MAERFGCEAVCVTEGSAGAWIWQDGDCRHHPGYTVKVADPIGAGDAFLAAFVAGLLAGKSGDLLLALANRLGAFVAARPGATPAYDLNCLDDIGSLSLS